ncbi:hypothetical protein QWM81_18070 [Streptomyces ficellus]|uniref:Uncharacterized protein n=1 Tax=Streptomyces ficellus TaxID=1977088 RepID=A0ABT7Z8U9_9ACTN|nr:hypothetical protein [Streptomyces ficellus]MDN3295924.1 hypothetical protein [Streptomyces ficellus]
MTTAPVNADDVLSAVRLAASTLRLADGDADWDAKAGRLADPSVGHRPGRDPRP